MDFLNFHAITVQIDSGGGPTVDDINPALPIIRNLP